MKLFRQYIVHRLFSAFMVLHILNLSMDATDVSPDAVPEDLSFNEIESIAEFILEDIFHIYNALPEHDEQDEAAEVVKTQVVYIGSLCTATPICSLQHGTLVNFIFCPSFSVQPTLDIFLPPPKA